MIRKIKNSLFYLFALSSFGCEVIVEVDVPDLPARLVVYGVINPDSIARISVSDDLHVLDLDSPSSVTNANVNLVTSEQNRTPLALNGNFYSLSNNSILQENEEYIIEVSADGYESVVASTKIPQRVEIEQIVIDENPISFLQFEVPIVAYPITVQFTDPPGEDNYYRLGVFHLIKGIDYKVRWEYDELTDTWTPLDTSFENTDTIFRYQPVDFESNDVIVDQRRLWRIYEYKSFTDELIDGQTYGLDFIIDEYFFSDFYDDLDLEEQQIDSGQVDICLVFVLASISKELYDYYTSFALQDRSGDDPFAEPIQVRSNVENGLGIFGAQVLSMDTVSLEPYLDKKLSVSILNPD